MFWAPASSFRTERVITFGADTYPSTDILSGIVVVRPTHTVSPGPRLRRQADDGNRIERAKAAMCFGTHLAIRLRSECGRSATAPAFHIARRWKSSTIFLETYVQPVGADRAVAESINRGRYDYM